MQRMQRLAQNEWLATITAVGTGSGTAAGMSMEVITVGVALVGAFCAVASTIAAMYFHNKNYKVNLRRLCDEREERAYQHEQDQKGN